MQRLMKIFLEAGCFLWVVNLARSALLPSAEKELDLKNYSGSIC
jgi:hypothetical protein